MPLETPDLREGQQRVHTEIRLKSAQDGRKEMPFSDECAETSRRLPDQDTSRWFLAFSKPKQEGIASEQLLNQGFETYVPMFKKLAPARASTLGQTSVVHEPMFPRYVFFKPMRAGQSVSAARSTRGVTSLVSFGFVLATVNDETLNAIKRLERERGEADVADISPFQPGTRVRLREQGLQALEGLVVSVSSKRVKLLLEILGRQKELVVDHSRLELV